MMGRSNPLFRLLISALAVACLGMAPPSQGANGPEGVLFLSADALENFDRSDHSVDGTESTPALDLLVSYSGTKFRGLAEYLVTDEEYDLERLQLGWAPNEDTIVWLGRYHRPYSYWNTRLHHGRFLQTSIARPALEEWEDDGGILPNHSTGLLVELSHSIAAKAGLQFAFAAGAGTELTDDGLEPFDLVHPDGGHGLALDFRAAYLPDALGDNQIGITASYSDMDGDIDEPDAPDIKHDDQTTLTAYTDWQWRNWRVLSTLIWVRNDLGYQGGSTSVESFSAGYAQLEFEARDRLTVYARQENRWGDGDSAYLEFFDESPTRCSKLGVRFEAFRRQAFTLELSNQKTPDGDFHQIRVQWSAVLQ